MDQAVVAGVGNVYRAEVLFVHGLHPEVPAREVPRETWDAMWATLVEWLRRGVRQQRIVTTDPAEIGKPRSRMRRDESLYVYKRERCRRCGTEVRRWDLAGRWAYACETCQPRPRAADTRRPPPRGRGSRGTGRPVDRGRGQPSSSASSSASACCDSSPMQYHSPSYSMQSRPSCSSTATP